VREEGPSGAQVIGPEQTSPVLPLLPIVGIAAGTIVVVTLIVVLVRRPRYGR